MTDFSENIISQNNYLNNKEIDQYLNKITDKISAVNNLLLIPPDYTRKSSALGRITEKLYFKLVDSVEKIDILPASGTHDPMDKDCLKSMFGKIPFENFLEHNWRTETIKAGKIPAAKMQEFSEGKLTESIT